MKKRLLIAATVAATMSVAATAGVSITGDAYVSFASQDVTDVNNIYNPNNNRDNQRVRVKVVGSVGDTEVVAVIRNDGDTKVNSNSATDDLGRLYTDSLYLTTKIGTVSVKAGDYWGTIGLGAHSMAAAKKNAIAVSTDIGTNWKIGLFTANGSNSDGVDGSKSTNINVSGKITPAITVGAVHSSNGDFNDYSAKITVPFGGISIAAEYWDDTTNGATENDTTFLQIGGGNTFKWDVAYIENDIGLFTTNSFGVQKSMPTDSHTTDKLAPLGSMLIGRGARGTTATAVADVRNFTEILGVAVSTQAFGNTIKAIYTDNTLGDKDDVKGLELIVSRPLAHGATITANIGKVSDLDDGTKSKYDLDDGTNTGIRLDVKF